jgi:DNA repair exonuclease SbcCD ATPase subunit
VILQKLTIHNLASLEDAVIDFEAAPLADCDVFLISGKTGAGKSTILDAVCLALYAKTPRLESTRMQGRVPDAGGEVAVDDVRQILRRNTGEGFASLLFTGSNGIPYEAVWGVKRSHGKASGNLQGKTWSLANLHTGSVLTKDNDIRAEVQAAVGLSFEQFCRTTMLAQGEFTRFLNSRDDEKSEILEKITGVDIYTRIGARIYAITREREAAYREARLRSEAITLLPDEEVQRLQAELKKLESDYAALAVVGKEVQDRMLWKIEEERLLKQIETEQKEVESAKQKVEAELHRAQLQFSDLSTLNSEALNSQLSTLNSQLSALNVTLLQLQYLDAEVKRQAEIEKNLEQSALQIKEQTERRRQAGEQLAVQTADRAAREAVIRALRDSVDKWAKSIRATLHEGDLCPVCRQRVDVLPREADLDALFADADRQYKEADSLYRQLSDLCNKLDANLLALTKNQQQAQLQAEQSRLRLADLKAKIGDADEAALKEQLSALKAQLSTLNSQIAFAKRIEQLRQQLQLRQAMLDKVRQQHEQHQAQLSTLNPQLSTLDAASLRLRLNEISAQFRQLGEQKGAIAARLEKDAADRNALADLRAKTDRLRADFDRWSRLNALVGDATGKTFRTIAQSYILANLIHSANHYMQMLSPRYRLRVTPGTFIISIEDAYQGYISRPATTISGGESFLVSLALALALSDIGQNFSVNILFIDEGFGSLSGQPLQRAIDTLRQLHTRSGRRVGIISHIEEMKENIPVQIQLLQDGPASASTLKILSL